MGKQYRNIIEKQAHQFFISPKLWAMLLIISFLLVPHSYTAPPAFARPPQQTAYDIELHAYVTNQMETYKIPGMAIAIVRDGDVEYLNGFGIANAGGNPVTPDTPFLLASVSKSFTALGIMQLVEGGKLDLDSPVRAYLPWFAVSGGMSRDITVADLLFQISGFSEVGGLEANLRPNTINALEAGVRDLSTEDLVFTPGGGWEYSNLNYAVLGLLIEQISGQPYETYIEERIFESLEMHHSYASLAAARAGGAASGYYPFFGIPLVFDNFVPYTRATLPAAGLWSSVSDMSRYLIAHLSDGQYNGRSILSAESTKLLHQPGYAFNDEQGYAMGWTNNKGFMPRDQLEASGSNLTNSEALTVLFHDGDWVNYKSMAFLIPELEYGLIMLMNTNDPAIPSAFRFFAWDLTLIATGGQPQYFPPAEDYITQNSRWIASVILILLLLLSGGVVSALRKLKKVRKGHPTSDPTLFLILLIPLITGTALIGYIFLKFLPDHNASLPVLIRFAPDLGILVLLFLLFFIGWGIASFLLIAFTWTRRNTLNPPG
jgi:CubicO group peptidase (beta-lactamase class C family)